MGVNRDRENVLCAVGQDWFTLFKEFYVKEGVNDFSRERGNERMRSRSIFAFLSPETRLGL